jgi:hypothetical protein
VAGPLAIGALLAGGLTVDRIFLSCTAPALCAAGAAILLRWSGLRAAFARDHARTRRSEPDARAAAFTDAP